jgi:hypothetical protein
MLSERFVCLMSASKMHDVDSIGMSGRRDMCYLRGIFDTLLAPRAFCVFVRDERSYAYREMVFESHW